MEKLRHKPVSSHASLGELICLPSTLSSVDIDFCRTFLAAEGNFSSTGQSSDLLCPGACKSDLMHAKQSEKTQQEPTVEIDMGEKKEGRKEEKRERKKG